MRTIRRGVFETNSSSVHSVVIVGNSDDFNDFPEVGENKEIVSYVDYYGWKGDPLITVEDKLKYLATMIAFRLWEQCWDSEIRNYREDERFSGVTLDHDMLLQDEDYKRVNDLLIKHTGCDKWVIARKPDSGQWGYIDHQSFYESIDEFLEDQF